MMKEMQRLYAQVFRMFPVARHLAKSHCASSTWWSEESYGTSTWMCNLKDAPFQYLPFWNFAWTCFTTPCFWNIPQCISCFLISKRLYLILFQVLWRKHMFTRKMLYYIFTPYSSSLLSFPYLLGLTCLSGRAVMSIIPSFLVGRA